MHFRRRQIFSISFLAKTALFTCFSSILRDGSLISHIKCAIGEDFCKILLKVAYSNEFEVDVPYCVNLGIQESSPKAKVFQIASSCLKNPGRLNFRSRLKNLDRLKNLKQLKPLSRLRSF
jgi:hypothetical protein